MEVRRKLAEEKHKDSAEKIARELEEYRRSKAILNRDKAIWKVFRLLLLNYNEFRARIIKSQALFKDIKLLAYRSWWYLTFYRNGAYGKAVFAFVKEHPDLQNEPAQEVSEAFLNTMNDTAASEREPPTQVDEEDKW
jgi:hypothetical protein